MNLEITAKVHSVLPPTTGNGRNGVWVKQSFVLELDGQFPRQVCLDAWGDKADIVKNLRPGEVVKVSFEPESREFNGKWYTNLKAWRIERAATGNAQAPQQQAAQGYTPPPPSLNDMPPEPTYNDGSDDLPF